MRGSARERERETENETKKDPLAAVLAEPTVHFVVLAALLFVASALLSGGDGEVIEVDRAAVELRILQTELEVGRRLDREERLRVEEEYVGERVLVREARKMGLENDERIDDILVQKMLHVLSGDVIQPTDRELEAYYEENADRYATSPSVSVEEVVVLDPEEAGTEVPVRLRAGEDPATLRSEFSLSVRPMSGLNQEDLEGIFSVETAAAVLDADPGTWVGPHVTPRGHHWIRIRERTDASVPPLDAVRARVRLDWVAEREEERLAERVDELRSGYTIRIVEGSGGDRDGE